MDSRSTCHPWATVVIATNSEEQREEAKVQKIPVNNHGAGRGSRTPKDRSPADFESDGSEPEDKLNE